MEDDDESSKINYQKNYNLRIDGTPNNNKRPRTKSFENDLHKLSEPQIPMYKNRSENGNKFNNKQMTSPNKECDLPPISLKFKREPQSTDRHLINELITWWKSEHKKNDTALNSIRADFHSLQQVQSLLQGGFTIISQMRLPVKIYYRPVRVKKCTRCFSHEHTTNRCSNQQVCIRCGQQHPFNNDCQNEIRCVNCQHKHYAGHASCPVVQQKRKQLAEQQKINRSKLLINASNQQYEFDQADFPLPILAGVPPPPIPSANCASLMKQQIHLPQQQLSSTKKETRRKEHIEQISLSALSKIETRLSTLGSSLTSQLTELETKIDKYSERLEALEHDVYDTILPAIQVITEIAAASSRTENAKQQLTRITETIKKTVKAENKN